MGLPDACVKVIKDEWKAAGTDFTTIGVKFFKRMLINHPELMPNFPKFAGKTPETLSEDDEVLKKHATAVVKQIDLLVNNADKEDVLKKQAESFAQRHKLLKVDPDMVALVVDDFISVLGSKNQEDWRTFFTTFLNFVREKY